MKKKLVRIAAVTAIMAVLAAVCFWPKTGGKAQPELPGADKLEETMQTEQPDMKETEDTMQPEQPEKEETDASASGNEQSAQTDASGNPADHSGGLQPRPVGSMKVEITEPEYVYLPDQETEDENLIFEEWVAEETENGETSAKYQDVTEVENVVAIPSVYGKAGETVSAVVKLCGQVELCAFDLRVTYDPEMLKYIQYSNAEDDLIVHCNEESGTVMMNFLRMVNVEDALNVCELRFEVLTDLTCETPLEVEVIEAISLDENGEIIFCNFSIVDAKVRLNENEG